MSDHLSTATPPGSTPEPESLPHEAVAPPPATEELPHTAYVAQWRQTDTLRALRELLALSEQVAPVLARRSVRADRLPLDRREMDDTKRRGMFRHSSWG